MVARHQAQSTATSASDAIATDDARSRTDTWGSAGAAIQGWLKAARPTQSTFDDSTGLQESNAGQSLLAAAASSPSRPRPADPLEHYEMQQRARSRALRPSTMRPPHVEGVYRGIVLEVCDGYFSARVTNGDPTAPALVAEFEVDDLPEDDRTALQTGSLFHVTVAKDHTMPHRPRKVTAIRLQRIRRWPEQELEMARRDAASLLSLLADDAEQHSP